MSGNWKKYFVEFIGTFFLVLTIGATAAFGSEGTIAPIAIGLALMIMVYAGGHISGGHYNPAVSLAAVIRGALPAGQWIPYVIFQILGGCLAAVLIAFCFEDPSLQGYLDMSTRNVILGEFLFTFALCYVVLLTATAKKAENNSYYGLAIGSTVIVGAFAVGGICLGAFNPAVAISAIILGIAGVSTAIITLITNLVAAICAGLVYKAINVDDCE